MLTVQCQETARKFLTFDFLKEMLRPFVARTFTWDLADQQRTRVDVDVVIWAAQDPLRSFYSRAQVQVLSLVIIAGREEESLAE